MKHFFIISICCLVLFPSYAQLQKNEVTESREQRINKDSTVQSTCPFITQDNEGNIIMSWVKELNDSVAIMCFSTSKKNEQSFGKTIEIPSSKTINPHGENLPKIIFKPSGEIIAVWGTNNSNPKNKYSGLIYYAQSFNKGETWTDALPLVSDTASYDQRYFDVSLLPNGEAAICWLDNREKKGHSGSTLYYAETSFDKGFQNEKIIGETCCPCCRTDLFVDKSGFIHVAYRDIINDSIRDMVHSVSINKGVSFSKPKRISADNWVINGCPHTGPTMTENKFGIKFAWHTMGGGSGVFFNMLNNNRDNFSLRDTVSSKPSAKHAQITALKNDYIAITWDETVNHNNHYNSIIRLQLRDINGNFLLNKNVSSPSNISEFPVIKEINSNYLLVAWTQRSATSNVKHVTYKIIKSE